jgi:hypothetical protein
MNIGMRGLYQNSEDFRMLVGSVMNLSRVCFGTFNYIFLLVTLKRVNSTRKKFGCFQHVFKKYINICRNLYNLWNVL